MQTLSAISTAGGSRFPSRRRRVSFGTDRSAGPDERRGLRFRSPRAGNDLRAAGGSSSSSGSSNMSSMSSLTSQALVRSTIGPQMAWHAGGTSSASSSSAAEREKTDRSRNKAVDAAKECFIVISESFISFLLFFFAFFFLAGGCLVSDNDTDQQHRRKKARKKERRDPAQGSGPNIKMFLVRQVLPRNAFVLNKRKEKEVKECRVPPFPSEKTMSPISALGFAAHMPARAAKRLKQLRPAHILKPSPVQPNQQPAPFAREAQRNEARPTLFRPWTDPDRRVESALLAKATPQISADLPSGRAPLVFFFFFFFPLPELSANMTGRRDGK